MSEKPEFDHIYVKPAYPQDAPVPKGYSWLRFRNSFLQPRFLYSIAIRDWHYDHAFSDRSSPVPFSLRLQWQLEKLFWFWPRITESYNWTRAKTGESHDPVQFRDVSEATLVMPRSVVEFSAGPTDSVLDVGCNCGRHLQYLYDAGFRDLHGVDASSEALAKMGEWFPDLSASVTVHCDLFQRFLGQCRRQYDIVMSHGTTFETVHPSFDVVRHLCRVARNHVVLVLNDSCLPYPRHWAAEFRRHGFELVHQINPVVLATTEKVSSRQSVLFVFSRAVSPG